MINSILNSIASLWDQFIRFGTDIIVPLGWQIAFVIGIIVFKEPIEDFLRRIRHASSKGFELAASPQAKIPFSDKEATVNAVGLINLNKERDPSLEHWFLDIKTRVDANPAENKEDALIDAIATAQRGEFSQYILRHIFGTQLNFLYTLNDCGWTDDLDKQFFDEHIKLSEGKIYRTSHDWLAFLLNQGLIGAADKEINITDRGRSFINYAKAFNEDPAKFVF
jgi:hypothetical protein